MTWKKTLFWFIVLLFSPRFSDNVLTDKDCENVYELVYSSHRAVAQAAGEFLNAKLFTREPEEPTKTKRGVKRSENTPLMRDLVQFFIESEVREILLSVEFCHKCYIWHSAILRYQHSKCIWHLLLLVYSCPWQQNLLHRTFFVYLQFHSGVKRFFLYTLCVFKG